MPDALTAALQRAAARDAEEKMMNSLELIKDIDDRKLMIDWVESRTKNLVGWCEAQALRADKANLSSRETLFWEAATAYQEALCITLKAIEHDRD